MKNFGLLIGFLPLIVYGILAGSSVTQVSVALAVAIVISVLVGLKDLKKGMILSWANVFLFCALLVAIILLNMNWIIAYIGVLIYATLAIVTFGSIVVKIPFTMQYAREMVDPSLWENPRFIRINLFMTGVWGLIFLINLGINLILWYISGVNTSILQMIPYVVLILGIIFTITYPNHIRKKMVQMHS